MEMKKTLRICLLMLLCLIFLGLCGAMALSWYYSRTFAVNTWINGIYCTGKTVEEVNSELIQSAEIPQLTIIDDQGKSWLMDLSQADFTVDYTGSLTQYQSRGNTFWLLQTETEGLKLTPEYSWNEEKLKNLIREMEWVIEAQKQSIEVTIQTTEGVDEPYQLYDGKSHRLDIEKLCNYVQQCLTNGMYQIDVNQGDCFTDLEETAEDVLQREHYEELYSFLHSYLIYDMGAEQLELTPMIMAGFLRKDSQGNPIWDQGVLMISADHIREWVEQLALQYDTVETTRDFQTTEGRVVQVNYNTYGTQLDVEAEVEFLTEALQYERNEPLVHRPSYLQEGYCRGLDDIGDTYIEVDMGQQHMYYYQDGECLISVDVVTGNAKRRWDTPEGINYVYSKQKNRVLRGEGYATPVKYWMAVVGHVGIHDASWRKEFGGDIYQKNGSHGCINTPSDVMGELYELVEVGTPVIMFY